MEVVRCAIHAVEIPSGHERGTRAVYGLRIVAAVDDALAVADDGATSGSAHGPESLVLDVTSGAARYQQESRSSNIGEGRASHGFVFIGESSVSMIDDATGKARWTTAVPRMDGATSEYFDKSKCKQPQSGTPLHDIHVREFRPDGVASEMRAAHSEQHRD